MRPPIILIPGKIDEINEYVLKRTGCFAFLVSDKRWHYSEPNTGKGAVELWSVALYAVYHDYGCKYIDFILDSNNCPDISLEDLLFRSRRHKRTVARVLRTSLAHGVLDSYSFSEFKRIFFAREESNLEQISDEKWLRVAEKIRRESDDLVNAIYKWADGYQNNDCNIREKFGASDQFKKSIDSRIMFETLDNDYCGRGEKRAREILGDISRKKIDETISLWREEVSTQFIRGTINTPAEIINRLRTYLFELHQPMPQSSVTIGDSLGFSLSSLL